MRIMKALLICLVAALVVMGCSKKMAAPEASPAPAAEQAQEMTKPDQAMAAAQVEEVTLNLTGVTWGGCVAKVQSALTNLPGVTNVNVNLQTATVKVQSGKVSTADLTAAVEGAGFGAKAAN